MVQAGDEKGTMHRELQCLQTTDRKQTHHSMYERCKQQSLYTELQVVKYIRKCSPSVMFLLVEVLSELA